MLRFYLSIYLSILCNLYNYPFVYLPINLSVYPYAFHPSIIQLPVHLSDCPSIHSADCVFIHLSINLSIHLSTWYTVSILVHQSVYPSICLSIHQSISPAFTHIYLYLKHFSYYGTTSLVSITDDCVCVYLCSLHSLASNQPNKVMLTAI